MSGGKTSSSTTTKTTQNIQNTTTQADASGVIGRDVFQAENITIDNQFSPQVAGAFKELIDLTNTAIVGAGDLAIQSLEAVSERAAEIDTPQIAVTSAATKNFLPFAFIGAALIAVFIFKRK